ncbi:hypothetical protein JTB14_032710 [Gonioctena quinquepunctata]|nr:hypothetical protein JTB14_032710 [Gonioctena quinquepunctata]
MSTKNTPTSYKSHPSAYGGIEQKSFSMPPLLSAGDLLKMSLKEHFGIWLSNSYFQVKNTVNPHNCLCSNSRKSTKYSEKLSITKGETKRSKQSSVGLEKRKQALEIEKRGQELEKKSRRVQYELEEKKRQLG